MYSVCVYYWYYTCTSCLTPLSITNVNKMYRIFLIRRYSYYLFCCSFCVDPIWGQYLFLWKARRHQWRLDKVRRVRWWWLLDAVSSVRSLSVLLSAMGMTCTIQTVLALAWRPSSEIIHTHVHVLRLLVAATIWGQRLFRSRASDCAATIRGQQLLEEIR